MSFEILALWTIKTLEEGQTLVKELCCSKLHAANCTHCSLLEILQRLLQKWRDVYAETDKGQADQSGYIIVDSKSQINNGGYEQVLSLGKKERRSNFGRRIKSVHESFESPIYCDIVRPYISMEQNIQSLTTSNILTKENCSDTTNKIDPKSFENFEEQGNNLSRRSKTLENKCKFKIVRINTIENSVEQGNFMRQRSKTCESKYSRIQEIINGFQNKITEEEEENKRNKSVYNKAPNENMMKRPGMNSFDVVVDKTPDVNSKFSECQVKSISEVTDVPTKPIKPTRPTVPSPYRPRKLPKPLWSRKSPEPLRPVKHAESIKSTKLPEPPRPLKGNICDTPLPFIPVDGYLDVRSNRIISAESLKPIKQKIPLRPEKSAEPLRPVTNAEPINSTKPPEPPRPSRPSKGNICDTPLPFIPVDGYLDVRRNRIMPQATDLTEVTRVSNIVVNKNKLGKRIIGIKQNEIFVFPNFYELYADFVLDLNSTFSCNNTDSYLVLQNSAMQLTITFYDKIATDKWRQITSKNHQLCECPISY